MRKVKFVSVLVLLSLLLSVVPGTVMGQGPPPQGAQEPVMERTPAAGSVFGVPDVIAEDMLLLSTPADAPGLAPLALLDIWLYVPRYNQADPLWADGVMQTCGYMIGTKGCLLTSATMVFKYYGSSKNPGQVNSCMGTKACPWYFAYGADHCSENKASHIGLYYFSYSTLVWALESGRPPILELTKNGDTHWVVVNAVRGDGLSDSDYWISDPSGGALRKLTFYTNNGWGKNRIEVYGRR